MREAKGAEVGRREVRLVGREELLVGGDCAVVRVVERVRRRGM